MEPVFLILGQSAATAAAMAIDGWLNMLARLLRLPAAEQQAIRDELAEHLHERMRDLMLGGATEQEALRTSISELGEAADLAQRFRAARRYRIRRTAMHASLVVLGAGFMGLGLLTLQPATPVSPVRISAFETQLAEAVCRMLPSVQQVRMVSSGTEATMSAIRLARGVTGRARAL